MRTGRPTKYKPEFAQLLFQHMSEGGSFEAFCSVPKCTVSRLYAWLTRHAEFREAKEAGEVAGKAFWENLGKAGQAGQLRTSTRVWKYLKNKETGQRVRTLVEEREHPAQFNSAAWALTMKNRYGYRDKHEVEQTTKVAPTDLSSMTEEELRALGGELAKKLSG